MEKHPHWIIRPFYRATSSLANIGRKRESAMDKDYPFYHVARVFGKIHRTRGSYLSTEYLESLNIKVSEMDLETGRPGDFGPQFCRLYPRRAFDKLFEKVSTDFRCLDGEDVYSTGYGISLDIEHGLSDMGFFFAWEPSQRISAYFGGWNDAAVEVPLGFSSCRPDEEPDFDPGLVFQAYNKYIPHRGCILFDGAISDDRLRRSEVHCATALMASRLQQAKKTDLIVPVFIYSISGLQGRVIQAHYEHPYLVIRKTQHIVFEKGSASAFKLMMRWILNTPTGDVKMPHESKYNTHNLVKILKTPFAGGK